MDGHMALTLYHAFRSQDYLGHVICFHVHTTTGIWLVTAWIAHHSVVMRLFWLVNSVRWWSKSAALITKNLSGDWLTHSYVTYFGEIWLAEEQNCHFHSACTECIIIVLCRREFGWSSFVFSNQAFFFARKSCERSKRHAPVRFCFVMLLRFKMLHGCPVLCMVYLYYTLCQNPWKYYRVNFGKINRTI